MERLLRERRARHEHARDCVECATLRSDVTSELRCAESNTTQLSAMQMSSALITLMRFREAEWASRSGEANTDAIASNQTSCSRQTSTRHCSQLVVISLKTIYCLHKVCWAS